VETRGISLLRSTQICSQVHLRLSNSDVENLWSKTSTPPCAFVALWLIEHTEILTVLLFVSVLLICSSYFSVFLFYLHSAFMTSFSCFFLSLKSFLYFHSFFLCRRPVYSSALFTPFPILFPSPVHIHYFISSLLRG
jgi:hypothetical protein